jgi:hypothetical protein
MSLHQALFIPETEEEGQGRCWDHESVLSDAVLSGGLAAAGCRTKAAKCTISSLEHEHDALACPTTSR